NNQEADQHQHRDTGDPTPHPPGIIVSAHHGVTQPRIRISKTWISHGPPPWFGTLCVASNEGNPLAVTAVPKEQRIWGNQKDQATRVASRHAAQKTKKKAARKTGKLAVGDQCSTVRPTP